MTFYRYIAEGLFFAFVLLIIAGSFVTIRARILMHTVLGLAVALLGVAGIYFYPPPRRLRKKPLKTEKIYFLPYPQRPPPFSFS